MERSPSETKRDMSSMERIFRNSSLLLSPISTCELNFSAGFQERERGIK